MNDFSRQANVFKPDEFNTPVTICGVGATGSWLTLLLAKLGIKDITVYDFDTVGEHNLPNQFFEPKDIGYAKVTALSVNVGMATDIEIKTVEKAVTQSTRLNGIVFLLTDSMSSRKEIWNNCIKFKTNIPMMVETRMGLRDGRIYCVNPMNLEHIKEYEATLYDDTETEVSACGVSQSIAPTATLIASMAVWKLLKFHNGKQDGIRNEIIMDIENGYSIDRKFSEGWN